MTLGKTCKDTDACRNVQIRPSVRSSIVRISEHLNPYGEMDLKKPKRARVFRAIKIHVYQSMDVTKRAAALPDEKASPHQNLILSCDSSFSHQQHQLLKEGILIPTSAIRSSTPCIGSGYYRKKL